MKKFASRKLLAFLLSTFGVPFLVKHNVPPAVIEWVLGVAGAYIAAQGTVDAVAAHKGTL